jgi:hypothetical protein
MLTYSRNRPPQRARFACATALALLAASARANAEGPAAKAAAQSLFDEGSALLRGGAVAAACPKLEQSLELDRGIGTLLFLADCYERSGRSASAWAMFHEVAAEAGALGQTERATVAKERAERLTERLPRVTIQVPAPLATVEGLRVLRDGQPVGAGSFGSAIAVDPGFHRIEATAPGFAPFDQRLQLDERDLRVVTLHLERAVTEEPSPRPTADRPPETAPPPAESTPGRTTPAGPRTRTIALAATGTTLAVVGGFFGFRAFAKWDAAQGHCDGRVRCDQAGLDRIAEARAAATVSTIALSAAMVTLSVSGYLLYRDLHPSLQVGPGSVALRGSF